MNPYYLDGIHKQERETEKLLTKDELSLLEQQYAPWITIGSHHWEHVLCYQLSRQKFTEQVKQADEALREFRTYIPFFAFPFGKRSWENLYVLHEQNLIPVFMDGRVNLSFDGAIHREEIDEAI